MMMTNKKNGTRPLPAARLGLFLLLLWSVGNAALFGQNGPVVPDFVHANHPHLMAKNPYSQLTPDTSFYTKVRLGQMPLLVLLAEFSDSLHKPGHDAAYFDDLVFGAQPSVNGYWREVSYGKFGFSKAGIVGWHQMPRPANFYFDSAQTQDNYITLAADAARTAAQAGFNFRSFDKDGNGRITQDELVILLVVADHAASAFPQFLMTRPGRASASGVQGPDGVQIDTIAMRVEENIYVGNVRNPSKGAYVSYYAHELGHAAHALPDLYNDTFGEDGCDYFTIMATAGLASQPHLDPWAKIHLGWLTPKVVTQSGWYTLNSTEKFPEALIVYNPARNGTEYFIIENRNPRDSLYEVPNAAFASFFDSGLTIWHITEFYDNTDFDSNRGRKMIGMKLARGATSMTAQPLRGSWDGADPLTAHNFTDNSAPRTARWADGSPSRVQILNIPEAGSQMRFYIGLDAADVTAPPKALASPDALTFEAPRGQIPAPAAIRLSNAGGGTMSFSATTDVPWLAVRRSGGQAATGNLGPGEGAIPWLEVSIVNAASLTAGTYNGRVLITTNGGNVAIPVSFTVVPAGPPPFTSANILHGATGQTGPVAPGLLLNLRVNGYGPAEPLDFNLTADGLVDTNLGGTSVLFDGQPAPVLYASANLIKVAAPYALADRTSTEIQLQYNDVQSAVVTMDVVPARPGIFLTPGSSNRALVLNEDGSTNAPDNPAAQGSIVRFLMTGEGQTDPAGVDGKPAVEEVLPKPLQPVVVKILGADAEIYYVGAVPGAPPGQMEVYAVVPKGLGFGAAALRVQVGDTLSPFAVMYVSP